MSRSRVRQYTREPSFNYPHNHMKLKVLWLLANLDGLEFAPIQLKRGLTLAQLSDAAGVKYSTLARCLGKWVEWRFLLRQPFVVSGHFEYPVPIYHYKIADRGRLWLHKWLPSCPESYRERYKGEFQSEAAARKRQREQVAERRMTEERTTRALGGFGGWGVQRPG